MNQDFECYYEQLAKAYAPHARLTEPDKLVSHWRVKDRPDLICIVDNFLGAEFELRQRFLNAVRARLRAERYEEVGQAAWASIEPDDADWREALVFRAKSGQAEFHRRHFDELLSVWRVLFGSILRN